MTRPRGLALFGVSFFSWRLILAPVLNRMMNFHRHSRRPRMPTPMKLTISGWRSNNATAPPAAASPRIAPI